MALRIWFSTIFRAKLKQNEQAPDVLISQSLPDQARKLALIHMPLSRGSVGLLGLGEQVLIFR